jgi:hypothetical protein
MEASMNRDDSDDLPIDTPLVLSEGVMDTVSDLLLQLFLEDGDATADELGEERPAA